MVYTRVIRTLGSLLLSTGMSGELIGQQNPYPQTPRWMNNCLLNNYGQNRRGEPLCPSCHVSIYLFTDPMLSRSQTTSRLTPRNPVRQVLCHLTDEEIKASKDQAITQGYSVSKGRNHSLNSGLSKPRLHSTPPGPPASHCLAAPFMRGDPR